MTTAHRPTWKAAVGQANEGGWFAGGAVSSQRSALDAPAHTKLKLRQSHQLVDKKEALKKSLLELEDAEVRVSTLPRKPVDPLVEERAKQRLLKQSAEVDINAIKRKYDDSDIDGGRASQDENYVDDESDLDDETDLDDDSSSEDDDDEDDEAALQQELAKIRAEREAAKRREQEEEEAEDNAKLEQAAVLGNPLLNFEAPRSGQMKRRWNDDVVFRNQAKGEPAPKKRFINDTIRNDFHRRFLNKFIR